MTKENESEQSAQTKKQEIVSRLLQEAGATREENAELYAAAIQKAKGC